jgi:DNA processing protein
VRLSEEQRLDWLRLIRTDNIGPRTFRDLVNHYGGASAPARICSHEEAQAELKAARAASTSSRSASRIIRRACK